MEFFFDPDDENNLEEVFDELRGKLLQLDRRNVQADRQSEEITRLTSEKSEVHEELGRIQKENQKLQGELDAVTKTANNSEILVGKLQVDTKQLKSENEVFKTENEKLKAVQKNVTLEFTELQRKYDCMMEKVSIWHQIHEEVSQKQAQNQAAMLETAKQIGHARASTLYIHQLKQQVEVFYRNAFETIKHLQEQSCTRSGHHQEELSARKKVRFDVNVGKGGMNEPAGSSGLNNAELYWKDVNEKLRSELQEYKEELWTGLQALSQLEDIKGVGPHSNSKQDEKK